MDSGGGCVSITAWFTTVTSEPRTTLLTLIACRSPVADKHLCALACVNVTLQHPPKSPKPVMVGWEPVCGGRKVRKVNPRWTSKWINTYTKTTTVITLKTPQITQLMVWFYTFFLHFFTLWLYILNAICRFILKNLTVQFQLEIRCLITNLTNSMVVGLLDLLKLLINNLGIEKNLFFMGFWTVNVSKKITAPFY